MSELKIIEKPYKIKCMTCNPKKFHDINEKSLISDETFLDIHRDCDIQYLTLDEYERASDEDVTKDCNEHHKYTYGLKWFVDAVEKINRMGEDAQRSDFSQLTKGYFRQLTRRGREKGLLVYASMGRNPTFARKGFEISKVRQSVTYESMGIGKEFEKLLHDTRIQQPKIHDIRLYFPCDSIYDPILSYNPPKIQKGNGAIQLPEYPLGNYIFSTVTIHRKSVEVFIKCSRDPLIYNSSGSLALISHLERVSAFLTAFSHCDSSKVPPIFSWVVKSFHFNKDSHKSLSISTPFEFRVDEITSGFIRFYSKVFPDGEGARLEELRRPNKSVSQIADEMTRTGNYIEGKKVNSLTELEADDIIPIYPSVVNKVQKIFIPFSYPSLFVI